MIRKHVNISPYYLYGDAKNIGHRMQWCWEVYAFEGDARKTRGIPLMKKLRELEGEKQVYILSSNKDVKAFLAHISLE